MLSLDSPETPSVSTEAKYSNHLTQAINPIGLYPTMCSGFIHNIQEVMEVSHTRMLMMETVLFYMYHLMWLSAQQDLTVYTIL